jgi:hypothetical protein
MNAIHLRAPAPVSLAGQPSILGRHDRINCGPQVLIAAITGTAIRGVRIIRNADHV